MQRIEDLMILADDITLMTDKNLIELDILFGLVDEHEDIHFRILYEEKSLFREKKHIFFMLTTTIKCF